MIDVWTGHEIVEVYRANGCVRWRDAGGYEQERTILYPLGGRREVEVIVPGPMPPGARKRGIPGHPVLQWPKRAIHAPWAPSG